jgi:hypothetical protein
MNSAGNEIPEKLKRAAPGRPPPGIDSTTFVEISVDGAGWSHAAFGRRPEPAAYLLDFLLIQFTRALADQYSALLIHTFSPFDILGPLSAAQSCSKSFFGCLGLAMHLAANLTNVLISVRRRRVSAERKSNKASVDEGGFRGCQLASTPANQDSVLVIHAFLLSSFWVH